MHFSLYCRYTFCKIVNKQLESTNTVGYKLKQSQFQHFFSRARVAQWLR